MSKHLRAGDVDIAVGSHPICHEDKHREPVNHDLIGIMERSDGMSGEIVHIDIPGGADTTQTRSFWAALFGWQRKEVPGAHAEYFLASINTHPGEASSSGWQRPR